MKKKLLFLSFTFIMVAQMISAQAPSYVPTSGLVGYWGFNGNANDQSGNNNNGTVNGATLTTDRFGNNSSAYSFNGTSDYIKVLDNNSLDLTQNLTLSAWIQPNTSNTDQAILGKGKIVSQTGYALLHNVLTPKKTGISIQNKPNPVSESFVNSSQLNPNTWYNLVGTYNGSELKLYLNGTLVNTIATNLQLMPNSLTDLFIGCELNGFRFFNGKIDDVGIWNRALSQSEITTMYNGVNYSDSCNAVSGSLVNGLVAYYPFCGNANDQSGNGLNGLVNGAILTSDRFGNSNSAYSFDGNSKINCAFSNQYSPNASDNYTFSFWAENASNNFGMILQYYTYNSTSNISNYDFFNSHSMCPKGSYAFQNYPYNNPGGCSPTLINTNQWNHIIIVIKQIEKTFNVYKNGVFWFNGNVGNIKPYEGFLTIGNNSSNAFGFNGKIDDIGIWNRALTSQEITQLHNQNQCITNISVTDTMIINLGQLSYTNPVTYANNITIYPNPANTQVNISFNNITDLTGGNIKIVNSLGQQVATTPITLSGTNTTLGLNTWGGAGLYLVQIINAQGVVVDVKKIILQ